MRPRRAGRGSASAPRNVTRPRRSGASARRRSAISKPESSPGIRAPAISSRSSGSRAATLQRQIRALPWHERADHERSRGSRRRRVAGDQAARSTPGCSTVARGATASAIARDSAAAPSARRADSRTACETGPRGGRSQWTASSGGRARRGISAAARPARAPHATSALGRRSRQRRRASSANAAMPAACATAARPPRSRSVRAGTGVTGSPAARAACASGPSGHAITALDSSRTAQSSNTRSAPPRTAE